MNRLPTIARIIVGIAFASTLLGTVAGLSLLWPGSGLDLLWKLNPTAQTEFLRVGRELAGLLLLCLGCTSAVVGVGLLKGRAWAWWVTLVMLVLVVAVNFTRLLMGDPGELFGTPFTVLLLWLHTRPSARKFFLPKL